MFRQDRLATRERGFTLAEVLVATAVFALIFVGTLLIYDRSHRVFSAGSQASDLQQNTRVAYEKLVSDIRLAGFDYKRGGVPTDAVPQWLPGTPYGLGTVVVPATANGFMFRCTTAGTSGASAPTWNTGSGATTNDNSVVWTQFGPTGVAFDQPDEQIEYAWHSAITIRANFDHDADNDAVHYESGRERNLESTQFPIVTTGNHEIVTYALVSNKPGASNSDSVTFYADVNNGGSPSRTAYPGGNAERLLTISGVDLSNNNPPYTLNRYTLADDGSVVTTPLADNIRSLTFSYFQDAAGRLPLTDLAATPAAITDVGGGGQYNPASPDTVLTGRIIRGKIRAINVQLVGMNATSDANFNDATDTIAPNYRKFALQSTIAPRNLGITGLRQISANPPPAATIASVCYGYCGIAVVTWTPGTGTSNTTYDVLYDTSATGPFTNVLPAGTQTTYAVDLTQLDITKHYYFKVMAKNGAGGTISTNVIDVDVTNATKPAAPGSITATGSSSGPSKVSLTWTSPSTNASGAPSCNPNSATPLYTSLGTEIQGYRIYRSTNSAFNITDSGVVRVLDENGNGPSGTPVNPTPVSNGAGGWFWDDTSVTTCTAYYYKIQAVEWCASANNKNTNGDFNTGLSAAGAAPSGATAKTGGLPKAPTNLALDPSTTCSVGTNKCYPVTLNWNKVTTDTLNNAITVDVYHVYRLQKKNGIPYNGATVTQVATLTGQSGVASPITWSEPVSSNLQEHDPSDSVKFTYDYYVTADSCGEGGASNTVTVPTICTVGGTISASGSGGGDGVNSPYQSPTAVIYTPAAGKTPSSVTVSADGGTATTVTGSGGTWSYAWNDTGDGGNHYLDWTITVGTCTQSFHILILDDNPTFTLTTGTGTLATNGNDEVDLTLTNSVSTEPLNIQSIDVTWAGQTNLEWDSLDFPSGGSMVATGTKAVGRTVTFSVNPLPTGVSANDVTVPKSGSGSLVLKLKFSKTHANPSISASTVTGVTVHYKRPDTGAVILDCQIVP
jgi:prepilin-type N-terminal cleavage/methylation domain-containing protein